MIRRVIALYDRPTVQAEAPIHNPVVVRVRRLHRVGKNEPGGRGPGRIVVRVPGHSLHLRLRRRRPEIPISLLSIARIAVVVPIPPISPIPIGPFSDKQFHLGRSGHRDGRRSVIQFEQYLLAESSRARARPEPTKLRWHAEPPIHLPARVRGDHRMGERGRCGRVPGKGDRAIVERQRVGRDTDPVRVEVRRLHRVGEHEAGHPGFAS